MIETTIQIDGLQTDENFIEINDVESLQAMQNNLSGHYVLSKNIDATATREWNDGKGWIPVGKDYKNPFKGIFSGNGYVINGLFINNSALDAAGLFGYVTNAKIDHVGMTNVNITAINLTGGGATGALAGSIEGSKSGRARIEQCYVTGSVVGGYNVGGLAGYVGGNFTMFQSYNAALVTGKTQIGGLVGVGSITSERTIYIDESYNTGAVKGTSDDRTTAGGLVSYIVADSHQDGNCIIADSYNIGEVTGGAKASLGGLLGSKGLCAAAIISSYNAGCVKGGNGSKSGGLVGGDGKMPTTDSYWDKEVSGQASSKGGTGKTTAEMKKKATYAKKSWDFDNDEKWKINEGVSYPVLTWG